MEPRRRLPVLIPRRAAVALAAALAVPGAGAEVVTTEKAALERVFPGRPTAKRTLYLRPEQVASVERLARSKVPSAVVTVHEALGAGGRPDGHAVLDTSLVRTLPATTLVAIAPDGSLVAAVVLQFAEPPDYLPREGWLRTLDGRALDDELWPGRGVRRVTGSTLTVQALTDAVRRALAIHAVVLRGER